ncbi:hypothetical protein [Vibrio breoganii]|uniref:hypothetical protein n=1 Tax=Vibrio breoganii TaxID=553239 RepID=UPI0021C3FA6B|nr:hypothetical protein [Vibrio breoganii]MDN3716975.1 hypothetical protein [Vibrio breoganii]
MIEYIESIGWVSVREHGIHKIETGVSDVNSVLAKVDDLIPVTEANLYKDTLV